MALAPAAVTVVAPLWLLSALLETWRIPVSASHHHALALHVGMWTVAVSIIAIKVIAPLLTALAEPGTAIGPFLPLVWIATVAASTSVVILGGLSLILPSAHLGWPGLAAMVVTWLCVEIVGTLAIPAVLRHRAERPERVPTATHQALAAMEQDSTPAERVPHQRKLPTKASVSSAMTAEDILEGLCDIVVSLSAGLPIGIRMKPDGWFRTSHRELAEAFGIPRSNLVRRLDQLKRDGKIQVVSKQEDGTLIKIVNDTSQR